MYNLLAAARPVSQNRRVEHDHDGLQTHVIAFDSGTYRGSIRGTLCTCSDTFTSFKTIEKNLINLSPPPATRFL